MYIIMKQKCGLEEILTRKQLGSSHYVSNFSMNLIASSLSSFVNNSDC